MLVKARSFDHAYKVAEDKASADSDFYLNAYGQEAAWKFIEAIDCFLISDELKTGVELYSCFHIADEGTSAEDFMDRHLENVSDNGCNPARALEFKQKKRE